MRWIRLIGGWMLVALGGFALVTLAITYVSERLQPKETDIPLFAVLIFGTISGVCPIFLGWVLLRRKVQPRASQSVSPAPGPDQPRADDMGTLAIEVELRQEDLTQAQYWLFRQNYFIRYFYAMFLVVLIYVAASSGSIHWNALKLQHLLLPAVVISLPVMSWSNARIAFRIAQLRGRLKFRYGCSLAGLRVASADAMVETPWTTYVSAWETTSSFYLFQHRIPRILLPSWKSVPVIIPKRCCVSPAEVGQLRAMIACALGKRARIRPA